MSRKIIAAFMMVCFWASTLATTVVMTGCNKPTTQEIVTDATAVAEAALQIAQDPSFIALYPVKSADMILAANSLLTLAKAWTTGNSTVQIMAIAQTIQNILMAIPATEGASWTALIPIVSAAVAILVAAIEENQPAVTTKKTTAVLTKTYKSGVIKHRLGRSMAGDFADAWKKAGGKPIPVLAGK